MTDMNAVLRTLAGRSGAVEQAQQAPRRAKSNAGSGTDSIYLPAKLDMNSIIRQAAGKGGNR